MKEDIMISIIVPVYNVEHFIANCLDSLLAQTFENIEIICVNDGSTDDSLKVLKSYAKKDERLKIYTQKNLGPAAARNLGLQKAAGKYIMFCDSDDWYEPEMCQVMYKAIETSSVDVAICKCNLVFEGKNDKKALIEHRKIRECDFNWNLVGIHKIDKKMQINLNVVLWNKIWKKDIITQYDIKFPNGHEHDDDAFWYMYSFVAKDILFIEQKLYNYYIRSGSIMDNCCSSKPKNREDRLRISLFVLDYLKKHNMFAKNRHQFFTIFDVQVNNMKHFYNAEELKKLLTSVKKEYKEFNKIIMIVTKNGELIILKSKLKLYHHYLKYYFYLLLSKFIRANIYRNKAIKTREILTGVII